MRDELGLDYTTDNPDCVQLFCEALENYLTSSAQVMPGLEQLLEQDPAMPMALLFRAYLLKFAADPRFRAPLINVSTPYPLGPTSMTGSSATLRRSHSGRPTK